MPVRLRNTVLFLLLAAAALGSWLLRPADAPPESLAGASAPTLGYYINEAVFSGLDDAGRVIYRVAAERIEGFEDSRILNLDDVEIRYAAELDLPWLITAARARGGPDQAFFDLSGVVIESTTQRAEEQTRIEAEELRLEPQRRIASTRGPVRLAIGATSIDAVGLTADLQAETFLLESGVHGQVTR